MLTETKASPWIEWGSGEPTLVLLHYFGGAAQSWQWVAQQLPEMRCIALNLPGFGGTSPLQQPSLPRYGEAISKTIADLKLKDYILIGHSMGGKMALRQIISSPASMMQ